MDWLLALSPIVERGIGPITIVAGVFARLSTLVYLLPGLGERFFSPRIRLAAAGAMTLVATPVVLAGAAGAPESPAGIASMLAAEAIAGAIIGFSIRVAIFTLQTAGVIAAQHLSLAQLFSATLDDQPEPPFATLFMIAGIALAVSAGLHFKAVAAIAVSYEVMPFGVFPGASDAGRWAADRVAWSFASAFSLAMPFVILGFIYTLAMGAANRAMPQLAVAFVGAPAATLAGLGMLAVATPIILGVWLDLVDAIFATLMGSGR